jgi:hypothetical protein
MSQSTELIRCPLCAVEYEEAESRACHAACGIRSGCQLLRCPSCGYEIPPPARMTRWLSRWLRRRPLQTND